MAVVNFSGLASGIDTSSLIQAVLDQERRTRIAPISQKIANLTDTNDSLSQLKSLLATLKEASAKFRTLNGSAVAKNALSTDETVLSATASNTASNGTYALTVSSVARNGVLTFSDTFASTTAAVAPTIDDGAAANDRTISYTIGAGASQESIAIEITSSTTLAEIVTAFNSQSTFAIASAVNVGTSVAPDYRLSVSSLNEGVASGAIVASRGAALSALGVFDPIAAESQEATNAVFSIAGVGMNIERSSNSVTDVISGLRLSLESMGTAQITVRDDRLAATQTVQEFIDAFNEVVQFVKERDLVTRDGESESGENIFGPLASLSLDESVVSALRSSLSAASSSGRSRNTTADLGISTNRDGTLSFNSDTFEDALASDPEAVRSITARLGESLAATGGTIDQFIRFNGLIDGVLSSQESTTSALKERVDEFERILEQRQQSLLQQYSRLESVIGQLNSQQSVLSSLL